jgi:hypothetical protein
LEGIAGLQAVFVGSRASIITAVDHQGVFGLHKHEVAVAYAAAGQGHQGERGQQESAGGIAESRDFHSCFVLMNMFYCMNLPLLWVIRLNT